MTKADQKTLVIDLTTQIANRICNGIDNGSIPESWVGSDFKKLIQVLAATEQAWVIDHKRNREVLNHIRSHNI